MAAEAIHTLAEGASPAAAEAIHTPAEEASPAAVEAIHTLAEEALPAAVEAIHTHTGPSPLKASAHLEHYTLAGSAADASWGHTLASSADHIPTDKTSGAPRVVEPPPDNP